MIKCVSESVNHHWMIKTKSAEANVYNRCFKAAQYCSKAFFVPVKDDSPVEGGL